MVRRIALTVPVLLMFAGASLLFMAAHPPRTWAAHWTKPRVIARGAGQNEFGAVLNGSAWDIAWVDDDRNLLVLSEFAGTRRSRSIVLDRGEVEEPSLLRVGSRDVCVWVHNHNGSTDLMEATVGPGGRSNRALPLVGGVWPLEHPYLFRGPRGLVDVVFSWQRSGNFDVYLLSFRPGSNHLVLSRRLTSARYYSFFPRALLGRNDVIYLLHLESCCEEKVWNVTLSRYDTQGRPLGPSQVVAQLLVPGEEQFLPSQWAEDIEQAPNGTIWGAYAADAGISVFRLSGDGRRVVQSASLDPNEGLPTSLALALGPRWNYLFWDQPFDLGSYVDSQRFTASLKVEQPERAAYEAASDVEIHAVASSNTVRILWQAVTPSLVSHFETASFSPNVPPDLAQRFGLGLGNPWESLVVLLVVALGVAAITTMGNILTILGYGFAGFLFVRLLQRAPGRWIIFAVALSVALFLTFVTPGGPILFLSTVTAMGFGVVPFGLITAGVVLLLAVWLGDVAFRHVDDLYRVGLLVVVGVYFFAYVEAIVFVQQRLGYI